MIKPIDLQYSYKKQLSFTQQQRKAFDTLKKYDINVNQFIRQAVKEKLHREWKFIKEKKERIKDAPDWLYDD
jgi:hypothetical protein